MKNNMLYFHELFIVSCTAIIMLTVCSNGHIPEEKDTTNDNAISASPESVAKYNDNIIRNIEKVENLAKMALKSRRGEIVPIEDVEILYEAMVQILQDLTEAVKDLNNAYTFLNAEGIDRALMYNLLIPHDDVRAKSLILMKSLFEVTPKTISVIPESIVDSLLDIFENEENLALKAHALDILYQWLPKNPEIQVQVMKVKGLEPFYNQVSKLDISVVQTLLDLFNVILKEHLNARNEKIQKTKPDLDRLRLYQRIGFLERMSTPTVCNGLLDIFNVAWNFGNKEILVTVFNIIENTKPFCIKLYGGNIKASKLFDAFLKFVRNEKNIVYLLKRAINVTNLETVIQEYVKKIKIPAKRDEF